MSSFIAANPTISSGSAQSFEIDEGVIHNLLVTGNLTSTANIGNIKSLTVDTIVAKLGDIDYLTSGNVYVSGIVDALGNVIANHFIGNGTQLTGSANVGVMNAGDVYVSGQVEAVGNVVANYFIGNGTQLTGVSTSVSMTTDKYLYANVVETTIHLGANAVNTPGMLAALDSLGKISQQALDGYLIIPEGYVANAAVRLELGDGDLPVGSIVRQTDTGNSYLLTNTPSNIDSSWMTFTGVTFPVNTVFGRNGDVFAAYGDYFDNYIELSESVGSVPAGNSVSEALQMLENTKQDNVVRYSKWSANETQIISNSSAVPISYELFHNTGAANVAIVPMNLNARFTNSGNADIFTISTRVTFGNVSPSNSTVILALNGNTSTENRLAESNSSSHVHSISCPVFIPNGEFVEILAIVNSEDTCTVNGVLTIAQR
ncbi:hypothetical protein FR483_N253L [Paramecium bursaria Chlorella virus FR483]|uniref:Uncharacterized protein N253L n=1 Tax=Paramecium bursaria Chlorella virus FR483 TaxID=399781 RepID=A7J6V7_PBCVF|nr:hypothetical protein FR483_N253L [Paramecium bursaria Chlorella virus FR483]ABT15538.1 hypothetical protein FR483_N253L [Paramecium bursaria Chlorella virus FR483]